MWTVHRLATAFLSAAVALTALASVGCVRTVEIGEVLASPSAHVGDEIAVEGEVTAVYYAFGLGAYQLGDETGTIWVVSSLGAPVTGERLRIDAFVGEGITLGEQSVGTYLTERRRHE